MRVGLVLLAQEQRPNVVVEVAKPPVMRVRLSLGTSSVDGGQAFAVELLKPGIDPVLHRRLRDVDR